MNKNIALLTLTSSMLLLASCGNQSNGKVARVQVLSVPSLIYAGAGDIRVVGSDFVVPFNTNISGNLYYYEGDYNKAELSSIQTEFKDSFIRYHALSDRHFDYFDYSESEEGVKINNVKVINDSYGTEEPVVVEPFLYDLLKSSYEFTLNSNGKFNMFLGSLTEIYEEKLNALELETKSALDASFIATTDLQFSHMDDSMKERIDETLASIPHTKEELEGLLTFSDEDHSVTFHRYEQDQGNKLQISLGGNAKGFATEYVCNALKDEKEDIALLINSGFSSIKVLGTRPDSNAWNIRYNNPIFNENLFINKHNINPYEVTLSYLGGFNLSTSGYYNQYFYEYQNGNLIRRNHIINPQTGYSESYFDQVSVFLDNAGLADMYTTSLMNCTSVDEAVSLFNQLNEIYGEEDAELLLCYKADKNDISKQFSYSMSDISNLSSYNLPIVTLEDGTKYTGDYSDITAKDIMRSESKFNPDYQMVYALSSGLYNNAKIYDKLEYPENLRAKLVQL